MASEKRADGDGGNARARAGGDAQLEALSTHYHEVLSLLSKDLKARLLLVLGCIGVVVLMIFTGIDRCNENSLVGIASDYLEVPGLARLDPLFVSLLTWFALAFLTAQSCGRSLVIEQRAAYLRHLEARIDGLTDAGPNIVLMRYRRPRFFRDVNAFYLSTFLISVSLVGLGKLALDAKSTIDLFTGAPVAPCDPSPSTEKADSPAKSVRPAAPPASAGRGDHEHPDGADERRPKILDREARDTATARRFFAAAFLLVDACMFFVVVRFALRFRRDWPTAAKMVVPNRDWEADVETLEKP
jgi:hypothetical protein